MADTYTTNLNLTKPEPGAAEDTWGISLNADLDALDAIFSTSGTQINLNPNQVNFADNKKAIFGNSSDLQIYHNGFNSYIDDAGQGALNIRSNGLFLEKYTGEVMITAIADGAVTLYYNNALKLATTSTGIGVTGTVTSDGLTVDGTSDLNGNVTIGTSLTTLFTGNDIEFQRAGDSYLSQTGGGALNIRTNDGTSNKVRLNLATNGDISFYDDTGSSQAFFWDASAERLGIGTTSPSFSLDVRTADNNVAQFKSTDASATVFIADNASSSAIRNNLGVLTLSADEGDTSSGTAIVFQTDTAERARINSSGHLLVGTANASNLVAGFRAYSGGNIGSAINGQCAELNRLSSNGSILGFQKDGTTVGTIGVDSTDNLYIAGGSGSTKGLYFNDAGVLPATTGGGVVNNAVDLGQSGYRFKDLYLSGTANVASVNMTGALTDSAVNRGIKFDSASMKPSNGSGGDADNHIDLGTSSTKFKDLHLSGKAYLDTSSGAKLVLQTDATRGFIGTSTSHALILETAATERMRIDSSGKVGIGATSPSVKLDVRTSASAAAAFFTSTGDQVPVSVISEHNSNISTLGFKGLNSSTTYGVRVGAHTNDFVAFTSNTERMRIDSSGRVGIGTSSPNSLADLHVADTSDARIWLDATSGNTLELYAGSGVGLFNRSNNFLNFGTDNVERMRIDSTGGVGIGTTNPQAALHVAGGFNATAPTGNGVMMGYYLNSYGYIQLNGTSGGYIDFSTSGTDHKGRILYDNTYNYLRLDTNGSERLRIDSSGRLLVGTTSVGYSGVDLTVGATTDSQNGVSIQTSTTGIGYLLFGDGTGASAYVGQIAYAHSDNSMQFDTAGAERMRIDSSGNVGIGTSSPARQFHVHDASASYLHLTNNTTGSTGSDGASISMAGTSLQISNRENGVLQMYTNGTERMRIDTSGKVGINNANPDGILQATHSANSQSHISYEIGNSAVASTNRGGFAIYELGTKKASWVYNRDGSGQTDFSADRFRFRNNAETTEYARIDSTGNLLVGKTSLTIANAGTEVRNNGQLLVTADGDNPVDFNRLTSDGTIANFRKDSAVVGSIGTVSNGKLMMGVGGISGTNLIFADAFDEIYPSQNGVTTLGDPGAKFKDLHLSGETKFYENTANGNNYVSITAPSSLGVDTTYTLPSTYPANSGAVLIATTAGELSWSSNTVSTFSNGADNRLITATGASGITGETDLTYTSNTLSVAGSGAVVEIGHATAVQPILRLKTGTNGVPKIVFNDGADQASISYGHGSLAGEKLTVTSGDTIAFKTSSSERMRIDSSGKLFLNSTSVTAGYTGAHLIVGGQTSPLIKLQSTHGAGSAWDMYATSGTSLIFARNQSDKVAITSAGRLGIGTSSPETPLHVKTAKSSVTDSVLTLQDSSSTFGKMIEFVGEGSTDCRGIIGFQEPQSNAPELYITNGGTESAGSGVGLAFWQYISTARISPCDSLGDYRDNAIDLGWSNARFDDIYATNGTIQTSDRNEKQDIQALTEAEQRVATACKGLIRRFRWQDSVEKKDNNPDSDETARLHFGVIAQDLQDAFEAEGLDAGDYGMFISQTWEDDDGNEQTRLGVRYNELLAFIITTL